MGRYFSCSLVVFSLLLGGHSILFGQTARNDVSKQGVNEMTPEQLKDILSRNPAGSQQQSDELARQLVDQMRATGRSAVALLSDPDKMVKSGAYSLLSNMDELAIVPLLEAPPAADPYERYANMNLVLDTYGELRIKIAKGLDEMLNDKRKLSWAKPANAEEAPQPSRVCDEAYLMMDHLLRPWVEDEVWSVRKNFLNLSDEEKDARIRKARKSAQWKVLIAHG
jgi:hypothetical protein